MKPIYTLFVVGALLATSTQIACGTERVEKTTPQQSQGQQRAVTIHDLPKDLTFAGEVVPVEWGYVREAIEREVLTTSCMHTSTTLALRSTTRYFPIIEPILKKYGVPNDFKYLCVAESGLNENAYSSARAAGLWQFLAGSGKEYGLDVGPTIDERYNMEKATHAACKYLLASYEKFGSWTLAAASYNAGPSGVTRRLGIQGVENYWDLFLPEETMRYVPRILSFKILMADPHKYGFDLGDEDYLLPFEAYTMVETDAAKIIWSEFAAEHGSNYRQMRVLNPWIRDYETSNPSRNRYQVKMPTSNFKSAGKE